MIINNVNLKEVIIKHILNNKREYIIIAFIFIVGIFLGVLFVNNINEEPKKEISTYVNNYITKMKENENFENIGVLKLSIKHNILIAVLIWFLGTTVIGIPLVYGIILYRGFCLGYTIAAFAFSIGFTKGLIFIISNVLLHNLLFIPGILALGVSGFKLYKSIIKDNRKENIKLEIFRHTIFSLIMMVVLIVSSVVESFISANILRIFIKYF